MWEKIEKKINENFISENGIETYNKFYQSFLDGLNGKKENEYYNIEFEKDDRVLAIYLEDKKHKITTCLSFNYEKYKDLKSHEAVQLTGGVIVPSKEKGYKWETAELSIVIPVINLDNYELLKELSIKRKYKKEETLDYLLTKVANKISQQTLSVFKLKTELVEKDSSKKQTFKV